MDDSSRVDFRRSSFCSAGTCVEVGFPGPDRVAVRDGKRPSQPHQMFTGKAWAAFLQGVRAGEFDG